MPFQHSGAHADLHHVPEGGGFRFDGIEPELHAELLPMDLEQAKPKQPLHHNSGQTPVGAQATKRSPHVVTANFLDRRPVLSKTGGELRQVIRSQRLEKPARGALERRLRVRIVSNDIIPFATAERIANFGLEVIKKVSLADALRALDNHNLGCVFTKKSDNTVLRFLVDPPREVRIIRCQVRRRERVRKDPEPVKQGIGGAIAVASFLEPVPQTHRSAPWMRKLTLAFPGIR